MLKLKHFDHYLKSVGFVWQLNTKKRGPRVARYILRGLGNPVAASKWSTMIHETPVLSFWLSHNPRLLIKPSRPYISRDYSFSERAQIISHHYQQLVKLIAQNQFLVLARGHSVVLAKIVGKHDATYSVSLRRTDKFDREGELILVLQDTLRNRDIFYLVFSLNRITATPCLEIGCIQGPSGEDAREMIKFATKEFHGIRPRSLLYEAALTLVNAWNITDVFGASNESRVYQSPLTFADYNSFWIEVGGALDRNGMFRLPIAVKHRNLEGISSKHRSEHRKRISLRENLVEQIHATLRLPPQ